MSTKVFLTGGTGFLGAYIIQNLVQKGIGVRAMRRSAKLPFFIDAKILEQVEWVDGDVLDVVALSDAMKGVDAVIHSAAVVSFSKAHREAMYATNVEGTANVVNMALEAGVRRLVHVSSVAALGRTAKAGTVSEEKKWTSDKHNTHYGITKHLAEMQVWRGFAEGLEGVVINPATILGFGNWHKSSCAIFKNAYNEAPWYTTGTNGFVAVEDVAEATVQLLFSSLTEQRFIVSAENISFKELLDKMAESMNRKAPHRHAARWMGSLAWRMEALKGFFTGKAPLLTAETSRVAQSRTSFDNRALLQALPHFKYTPLDVVIKQAGAQYIKALEEETLAL